MRDIPETKEIKMYFHCGECLKEFPEGVSMQDYARYEIGFTELGLQVWCIRHNKNIVHIDFEGQTHPSV